MDPTIGQLLTEIRGELRGLVEDVHALRRDLAVVSERLATQQREIEAARTRQAALEADLRAVQRRLDEQEGARRAAATLGVGGVVSGLSGLGAALWAWLGGGS